MTLTKVQKNEIQKRVCASSIYKLIEDGYFSAEVPYPNRTNFKGQPCHCCGLYSKDAKEVGLKEYSHALKLYRDDVAYRKQMFKYACFYDLDIKDTLAAHKAWDLAWDSKHSDGLYQVYGHLEDLAEILRLM